jgi:zinc D-Ala-D-Ala dipeptidase/carboxypeptidase
MKFSQTATKNTYIEKEFHRDAIYSGQLILVNRNHPFRSPTIKTTKVSASEFKTFQNRIIELEQTCNNQLSSWIRAGGGQGKIIAVSGIRSEQEQYDLYNNSVRENGVEFTQKYVAKSKESEHHTGLAIDLAEDTERIDFICPSFPDKGVCGDMKKLSASYGFILRYQEDKESVTGISSEPWHFRFVGIPHAALMNQYGLCLEEYMDFIRRFPFAGPHLYIRHNDREFEIYYFPATEQVTKLPVPFRHPYEVSGNNTDGFIVTVSYPERSDEHE